MACPEFEDRLIEYAGLEGAARACVDTHIAECADCRLFLQALRVVDRELTARFARRDVSSAFAPTVRARVQREGPARRPSMIPELLDFVGWGAIVALSGLLAWWLIPLVPLAFPKDAALSLNAALAAGGAFLLIAFLIGLRSFAALKH
jgi:hypothetical protein